MKLFYKVSICIIGLFILFLVLPKGLNSQETRAKIKREGPVFFSVFLGENLRIEVTSAVFVKEVFAKENAADIQKIYIYSCVIKNVGDRKVKFNFRGFLNRPDPTYELDVKESYIATFESRAKPKLVPISQVISIVDSEGEWVTRGLSIFFIYVPGVSPPEELPSENNKKTSKNTA